MGSTYYAYHTMQLWPEFIAKGMADLNFCAHFALLIDENNKPSQNISENWDTLRLIKPMEMSRGK